MYLNIPQMQQNEAFSTLTTVVKRSKNKGDDKNHPKNTRYT